MYSPTFPGAVPPSLVSHSAFRSADQTSELVISVGAISDLVYSHIQRISENLTKTEDKVKKSSNYPKDSFAGCRFKKKKKMQTDESVFPW